MCGCGETMPYDKTPDGMAEKVKRQREDILRENMSLIEEKLPGSGAGPLKSPGSGKRAFVDDYDYGFSLHVSPDDPDAMHIAQHEEFLEEYGDKMRPQAKSRMKLHIAKHQIQKEAKEGY